VLLEDGARAMTDPRADRVPSPRGGGVPFDRAADVRFAKALRHQPLRPAAEAVVEADLFGHAHSAKALACRQALPMMKGLPQGVTIKEAGDAERRRAFDGFGSAMRNAC